MSRNGKHRTMSTCVTITAPHAGEAHVAGDFNAWNPWSHALQRGHDGRWTGRLELPPGRHEYKFLIDSRWCCEDGADPPYDGRPGHVPNPFGTMNLTVHVGEPAPAARAVAARGGGSIDPRAVTRTARATRFARQPEEVA